MGVRLCTKAVVEGKVPDTSGHTDLVTVLTDMVVACEQNVSVLNDLSSYEQLERRVLKINTEDTAIVSYVRDTVDFYRDKAQYREKCMVFVEPPRGIADPNAIEPVDSWDWCVRADPYRLEQAMRNILMLLFHTTPKSKVIEIRVECAFDSQCADPTVMAGSTVDALSTSAGSSVRTWGALPPSRLSFSNHQRAHLSPVYPHRVIHQRVHAKRGTV